MSTAGFDHHVDGERRAAELQKPVPAGFIILFSKSNERKGSAPLLTAVLIQNTEIPHSNDFSEASRLLSVPVVIAES